VAPLKTPVTLEQIKTDPALGHLALVRQSRLSVVPVDEAAWKHICTMGGVKP
jgi:predicted RNA-binding protein with PUA-like domain